MKIKRINKLLSCFLFITLFCKSALTQSNYDLIVYGATPGGITSAISAKKMGLSVLLVEPTRHIGGIMTSGLGATDHCNKKAVGGFTREFFKLIGREYNNKISWRFEPHVAQKVFAQLLKEYKIESITENYLINVSTENQHIKSIKLSSGKSYTAKYFIDASYEGDLLAKSGVPYKTGRESKQEYNESEAGIARYIPRHQFPVPISPFDQQGKLLPGISENKGELGSADDKTMAYNFRLCVTNQENNTAPFPKPQNYDPQEYELLARWLKQRPNTLLKHILLFLPIPNKKYDLNNIGPFSTDLIGGSWQYPEASYQDRQLIIAKHKEYTLGLMYFLQHDTRTPKNIQNTAKKLGLCKDEFKDNAHFPYQLYVRVARRMLGSFVLNQNHMNLETKFEDSIGLASCPIESHSIQRVVENGIVMNEGWSAKRVTSYQIPYRSITPKKDAIKNLIVPVAVSASHITYSSLRMEPVFMILGESAGVAIGLAHKQNLSVQDISIKELRTELRNRKQRLSALH